MVEARIQKCTQPVAYDGIEMHEHMEPPIEEKKQGTVTETLLGHRCKDVRFRAAKSPRTARR